MNEMLDGFNCISMYAELRKHKTLVKVVPPIRRAKFVQLFYVTEVSECGVHCDLFDERDCYTNLQDDVVSDETKISPLSKTNLIGFGRSINDCPIFETRKKYGEIIEEINFKVVTASGVAPTYTFNVIIGLKIFQEREKLMMWPRPKYKTAYIEIRAKNTKVKIDPPIYGAKFLQMIYMTSSEENGIFCDLVDETNSYSNIEQNKDTNTTEVKPSTFIGFGKSYDYPVLEIEKSKGEKIEEINIGVVNKEGSRSSLNMIVGLKIFH